MKTRKSPPFVRNMRTRHGKLIRYLRIDRKNICRLPSADYWTPEFQEAYAAAIEAHKLGQPPSKMVGAERTRPGSFGALIAAFYQSTEFLTLSKSTQTTYRGIMERFRADYGRLLVTGIERQHVRAIIAKRVATPAAASNLLRMIRILIRFAIDEGWRKDDPTIGVKGVKWRTGGFHSWTEDEIATFQEAWFIGTRERLAFDLLLYSGQRRSDVIRMGLQHVRNGQLTVRQQKTGVTLTLPMHAHLRMSLDEADKTNMTFLLTAKGEPFTAAGFGNWFRAAIKEAGLPKHCSAHGLRKAAARRLAEAGCSPHQIAAVTGHKSLKEIERYTFAADQTRMAHDAMSRVKGFRQDGE